MSIKEREQKTGITTAELRKLVKIYRQLDEADRLIWVGSGNLLAGSAKLKRRRTR